MLSLIKIQHVNESVVEGLGEAVEGRVGLSEVSPKIPHLLDALDFLLLLLHL